MSIAPNYKSDEGKNDLELVFHKIISGILKFCDETKALINGVFVAILLNTVQPKNPVTAVSS